MNRLASAFLLVVLLFITLVQGFHRQHSFDVGQIAVGQDSLVADDDCTICAYLVHKQRTHLSCDLPGLALQTSVPVRNFTFHHVPVFYNNRHDSTVNRGPPSLV